MLGAHRRAACKTLGSSEVNVRAEDLYRGFVGPEHVTSGPALRLRIAPVAPGSVPARRRKFVHGGASGRGGAVPSAAPAMSAMSAMPVGGKARRSRAKHILLVQAKEPQVLTSAARAARLRHLDQRNAVIHNTNEITPYRKRYSWRNNAAQTTEPEDSTGPPAQRPDPALRSTPREYNLHD